MRRLTNRLCTLSFLAVVGVAALIACGDDSDGGTNGTTGDAGPSGAQGTPGPQGPPGPPGASIGVDGGLPSSCLSPCHGFNGIVEAWKTSTHYATAIANTGGEEVPTWTGPGPCGNCHASDAIEQRVGGHVGVVGDAGAPPSLQQGHLEYQNPSNGALAESTYAGSSKVAIVGCTTCHAVTDATDPHRTGLPYKPGDFPLRVPSGAADQPTIEKSPVAGTVTGMPAGARGPANTCIWCHRSRKDVTNFIGVSNNLSPYWGPHEGPQADVFTAQGGYHFASKTYGTSTHEQRLTCVDCHMPRVATINANAPNHSFYPQLSACTGCHAGATTFDVAGGQSIVKNALNELQAALDDAGMLTRATSAPFGALGTARADGHWELDKARPGAPVTAVQAGALYNYFLIARGSAYGVHNPKYARQLLYDSIEVFKTPASLARP